MLLVGFLPSQAQSQVPAGPIQYKDYPEYERAERTRFEEALRLRAYSLRNTRGGQCVVFSRRFITALGASEPSRIHGRAGELKTDTTQPKVGDVVRTRESPIGHVAVVISATATDITVVESNYKPGIVTIRTIPINSPRIVGYINFNYAATLSDGQN